MGQQSDPEGGADVQMAAVCDQGNGEMGHEGEGQEEGQAEGTEGEEEEAAEEHSDVFFDCNVSEDVSSDLRALARVPLHLM